jgi:hypothetical protein
MIRFVQGKKEAETVKTATTIFLAIFFLSLVAYGVLTLRGQGNTSAPNGVVGSEVSAWVPLITAIGSLIGVATTSIVSLRRDRLESRKVALEMKKIQLEIDRLQKEPENKPGKEQ